MRNVLQIKLVTEFITGGSTYQAGTVCLELLRLGPGQEGLDLVGRIVAGIVVGPHDRLDHLGLVGHLGHDPGLQGLVAASLHGRQDLGLLPFRDTTESHSCKMTMGNLKRHKIS